MSSRFVENLQDITHTHPHLNVSLSDILAEENARKRSTSSSSSSSSSRSSPTFASSPSSSAVFASPTRSSPSYQAMAMNIDSRGRASSPARNTSPSPRSPPTSPGGLSRTNATRKRGFTLGGRKRSVS